MSAKYNFINDKYKVDFDVPDSLKEYIDLAEKADRSWDHRQRTENNAGYVIGKYPFSACAINGTFCVFHVFLPFNIRNIAILNHNISKLLTLFP